MSPRLARMLDWGRSGTETPSQVWGEWIFEDFFIFSLFFLLNISLLFFDQADCGTCFLLAKTESTVTRHSASEPFCSDRNAHTEVQHPPPPPPTTTLLDRSLRTRPRQLPKWRATALHGYSILPDRLPNEKEQSLAPRWYWHAPCQRDFFDVMSSATRHKWLYLCPTHHECFTSDFGLTRTRLVSRVFLTSLIHWLYSFSQISILFPDFPHPLRTLSDRRRGNDQLHIDESINHHGNSTHPHVTYGSMRASLLSMLLVSLTSTASWTRRRRSPRRLLRISGCTPLILVGRDKKKKKKKEKKIVWRSY